MDSDWTNCVHFLHELKNIHNDNKNITERKHQGTNHMINDKQNKTKNKIPNIITNYFKKHCPETYRNDENQEQFELNDIKFGRKKKTVNKFEKFKVLNRIPIKEKKCNVQNRLLKLYK